MKLVEGETLREVLDALAQGGGGWSQTRVLGLILKVCEAMSYAHTKGVIHRDLKPSNIMVGRFGEVYVMDWGLAKVLDRPGEKDIRLRPSEGPRIAKGGRSPGGEDTPGSPLLTMTGEVIGTPAYMSPEQAHGDQAAMGPHSDVYAVGAMLYHVLAGHMPYVPPGESPSTRAVWARVKDGPPHSLDKEATAAPAELVAICERAMARDASRRYPDMSALGGDLSAYLEGRVVRAYETGAWAEARKWMGRNKPLATSLATAILVLAGGLLASTSLWVRAENNASRAEREVARAVEVKSILAQMLESVDPAVARTADVRILRDMLDATAKRLLAGEIEDEAIEAELHAIIGDVYHHLGFHAEGAGPRHQAAPPG
jgi:serine/threonine-protein kinase